MPANKTHKSCKPSTILFLGKFYLQLGPTDIFDDVNYIKKWVYIQKMKVYINGFWKGFINGTDPVSLPVFLNLLSKVFNEPVNLGSFQDCEILLESIFAQNTYLYTKSWKYSFLFSGESRLVPYWKDFSCVLYGEENHDNIVNCPLYIVYLHSSNNLSLIENKETATAVPPKSVCALISNPAGTVRNSFLEKVETFMSVDYAGKYKNNVPIIHANYGSPEFFEFVKQYKFIVSMENSIGETYITEKITHGMITSTIPIYWGTQKAKQHFNENRYIHVANNSEEEIMRVIREMLYLQNNPSAYLEKVNRPVFANDSTQLVRSLDDVANDIKRLLGIL